MMTVEPTVSVARTMTDFATPAARHSAGEWASGKSAKTENFPVASRLIAGRLRPHVMVFYAFARAADDIADNPGLEAGQKLACLNAMEAALLGQEPALSGFARAGLGQAVALRQSLVETGISPSLPCALLAAFRQDATRTRYETWADLMSYCALSAIPAGHYLLALHGEPGEPAAASDALCSALQILNHVQDCGDDYRALNRVYLPLQWLDAAGAPVADLAEPKLTAPMRRVLDRALDECETLLDRAAALERSLDSGRLAAEAAVITRLAQRLLHHLRRGDPLARPIELSKTDFLMATAGGLSRTAASRSFAGRRRGR